MFKAFNCTKFSIRSFDKHRDDDEFLIYKTMVNSNVYKRAQSTPIMYLTNKSIWLMDWSIIQPYKPQIYDLKKIDIVEKTIYKTFLGVKIPTIELGNSTDPNNRVTISRFKQVEEVYDCIMFMREILVNENRYITQDEATTHIKPIFDK